MKKTLLLFIVVASFSSHAETYYEATLFFTDGTSKTGFVEPSLSGKYIYFKPSKDSKVEKYEAVTLSKIIFPAGNQKTEYHQVKVYGWSQKKINKPVWLKLVEKGIVTLYLNRLIYSHLDPEEQTGIVDYYCIREGEPAATLISQGVTINTNKTFHTKAPVYFEDYPELAARIESKEYTYEDVVLVVQKYNMWAANR